MRVRPARCMLRHGLHEPLPGLHPTSSVARAHAGRTASHRADRLRTRHPSARGRRRENPRWRGPAPGRTGGVVACRIVLLSQRPCRTPTARRKRTKAISRPIGTGWCTGGRGTSRTRATGCGVRASSRFSRKCRVGPATARRTWAGRGTGIRTCSSTCASNTGLANTNTKRRSATLQKVEFAVMFDYVWRQCVPISKPGAK